jgi:hypothetical protein
MIRRYLAAAIVLSLVAGCSQPAAAPPPKTDIVLILTDDLSLNLVQYMPLPARHRGLHQQRLGRRLPDVQVARRGELDLRHRPPEGRLPHRDDGQISQRLSAQGQVRAAG